MRILVVEGLISEAPSADEASFDLFMFTLTGGRERTRDEFRLLAQLCGLDPFRAAARHRQFAHRAPALGAPGRNRTRLQIKGFFGSMAAPGTAPRGHVRARMTAFGGVWYAAIGGTRFGPLRTLDEVDEFLPKEG